ncbi:hypothetical protein [Photobacterium piscicola]|uniref:Uncharacterized protein n=1 Tax=Photobacterium piscicola TaxID=1378299 RepID=A0ABU6LF98_9GAMM|nr:hypothetical protein [Photobacterium piscicola]
MIITLCNSIFSAIKDNDESTISFLDDMITARRNGFVSLLLSKKEILFLLNYSDFNSRQKAILNFDKENATYLNQELRVLSSSIKFYHSGYVDSSGDIDISLYKEKIDSSSWYPLTKPFVIFENKDDDLVYRNILKWYFLEYVNNKNLHLSYEVLHGGGHTTAAVSEQALNCRLGVYAICDSDKKSPHSNIGSTARDAKTIFDSKNYSNNFLCIEAHEVENLVPLTFHEEIALDTQKTAINFIKYAVTKESSSYLYYDFKESIKLDLILSDTLCGNYWKNIISNSKYDNKTKGQNGKIACKLSSLVKHSIKAFSESDLVYTDNESLRNEWSKIGEFLVPKVLASRPYKM